MKLELSTWQRLSLTQIIGEQQGPVSIVRKAGKLLDILEMTDEEKKEVGLVQDPQVGFRWNNTDRIWGLEISDGNLAAYLKEVAKGHGGWSVRNRDQVLDLFEKLEIQEES